MSPALSLLLFAATLLPVVQFVSGHASSPLWCVLEGIQGFLCVLYAIIIPWFAARPFRQLKATIAGTGGDGVAQIIAIRSSENRFSRFAVLNIDSSGVTTFQIATDAATVDWSLIDKISQVATGSFGQASVIVFGLRGEPLLDFIPMGNLGIAKLSPIRFHEYVERIVRLRQLR